MGTGCIHRRKVLYGQSPKEANVDGNQLYYHQENASFYRSCFLPIVFLPYYCLLNMFAKFILILKIKRENGC